MQRTQCDERGRIYLKEDIRAQYGEEFFVVEVPGELILIPVPKDPVKELARIGRKIRRKSLKQMKQAIAEQAAEESSK